MAYSSNLLPEMWQNAGAGIQDLFDTLNQNLAETTNLLGAFDAQLAIIDGHLLADIVPEEEGENIKSIPDRIDEHPILQQALEQGDAEDKRESKKESNPLKTLIDLSKTGENILKIGESLGELPPKLNSFKSTLEIFNDAGESLSKTAELFSSAEGTVTATEAVVTGAEVAAGAVGVAETASAFGPPGWVVAIAGLATAAAVKSMSGGEAHYAKDFSPDKMKSFYWNGEREKDRKRLTELYSTPGETHVAKVEKELDSEYMIADRVKRVELMLDGHSPDEDNPSHTIKKILTRFSDVAGWGVPITPLKQLLQKSNDRRNSFELKSKEIIDNRITVTKPASKLLSNKKEEPHYRLPTDRELENDKRKYLHLPPMPEDIPNKVKSNKMPATFGAVPNQGRVININLNKPMIEHFTINASSVREGLGDFKHKVEEILLEILNSANVIR